MLLGYGLASLCAAFWNRGLYADGAYYLLTVARSGSFHLVDPARTTVQVLRQAPLVFAYWASTLNLAQLGQIFSAAMLLLPPLLCALCWPILPREFKSWIVFPLLNLLTGVSVSSFAAVGEGAIAASCWWLLLFLLMFRTRRWMSQISYLLLSIPAFFLHEAAFPLMLVLLVVCALRWNTARGSRERAFLVASALLAVAIVAYEVWWIIEPRRQDDLASYTGGLLKFVFVATKGRVNLPVVTGAVALAALLAVIVAKRCWSNAHGQWTNWMMGAFAAWALAAAALPWLVDAAFSPFSQFQARNHAILVSAVLGLAAIVAERRPIVAWRDIQGPVLAITLLMCFAQVSADVAATRTWRAYVLDFRARLSATQGLVPWQLMLVTGDAERDRRWILLKWSWTVPIMSIILADGGVVKSIIAAPVGTPWLPFDPANAAELPKVRGIDYAPYFDALSRTAR